MDSKGRSYAYARFVPGAELILALLAFRKMLPGQANTNTDLPIYAGNSRYSYTVRRSIANELTLGYQSFSFATVKRLAKILSVKIY